MSFMLGCENVHLDYPTKKIFDSVTLGVDDGDRIGIVGANGDGKSTLLGVLAGLVATDQGRVVTRSNLSIGSLRQADDLDPDHTVGHAIVGDVPEHEWASDARTRRILSGLVADIPWDRPVAELSGGQRRRVDLARVLVGDFDVLMLDEPTNHLDVRAIAWLAEHLKQRWPKRCGALLLVTHDRWFLDEVCTQMWDVHDRQVEQFEGGYAAYVLQRVERARIARATEQKRRNLVRRELAWLSRGPQARSTKPKFRVDAARELIADVPPERDPVELKRSAMSRLGKQVVDLEDVSVSYRGTRVLDHVSWAIGPGDRFGILGVNGSGKTTLLNVISGLMQPTSGTVRIGKTVRFATLSQHLHELDALGGARVREVLYGYKTRYEIDGKELTPSQLLERLGFDSAQLSQPVCDLSGGQKRRLQLMLILLDQPNVLILDEPDNDLDTDMLAVVEGLLDTWPGTLLLITHDRYLMERVTDHQCALLDGNVRHLPGGVDEYLGLLAARDLPLTPAPVQAPKTCQAHSSVDTVQTPGTGRSLSRAEEYRLRKELASTERKLQTQCKKADVLRDELSAADHSDYQALLDVQSRLTDVEGQIASLEDDWIRLSELVG